MLTDILGAVHFAELHAKTQGTQSLAISDLAVLMFNPSHITKWSRLLIIIP